MRSTSRFFNGSSLLSCAPHSVKFLSRMFHPNVYANGELCLDILQNRWSPTYDVAAILTSIQSLLHDPNPNRCAADHPLRFWSFNERSHSPANAEAANLYRDNMKEYVKRVRRICVTLPIDHLSDERTGTRDGRR